MLPKPRFLRGDLVKYYTLDGTIAYGVVTETIDYRNLTGDSMEPADSEELGSLLFLIDPVYIKRKLIPDKQFYSRRNLQTVTKDEIEKILVVLQTVVEPINKTIKGLEKLLDKSQRLLAEQ